MRDEQGDVIHNRGSNGLGIVTWVASDRFTVAAKGISGAEQTGKTGPKRGLVDLVATPGARVTLLRASAGHSSLAGREREAAA